MNLQQQIEERLREQSEMVRLIDGEIDRITHAINRNRSLVGTDLQVSTADLVGIYRAPGSGWLYSIESVIGYRDRVLSSTFDEQAGYLNKLREFTDDKIEACYSLAVFRSPVQSGYKSLAGRVEALR